jgi:hypothetical protein
MMPTQKRVPKGSAKGGQYAPDMRGKHNIPIADTLEIPVVEPASNVLEEDLDTKKKLHKTFKKLTKKDSQPRTEDGKIVYRKKNGELHCENGPAITHDDGMEEYWQNNVKHRVDGPAILYSNGAREYWFKGIMHRVDGPAFHDPKTGEERWLIHGVRHREDGPAITHSNGEQEYWVEGHHYIVEQEYWKRVRQIQRARTWWGKMLVPHHKAKHKKIHKKKK